MRTTLTSMKLLTLLATLAVCAFAFPVHGEGVKNPDGADEAALRENVKQMEGGWNAKKGELFAKPFTEDADYVVINGMYIKGRNEIAKGHQQIFDTFYKNTSLRLSIRQIRFLRRDVALVHVDGHLDGIGNEGHPASDASITMVMTRGKQGWEIAAFQNTEVVANHPR